MILIDSQGGMILRISIVGGVPIIDPIIKKIDHCAGGICLIRRYHMIGKRSFSGACGILVCTVVTAQSVSTAQLDSDFQRVGTICQRILVRRLCRIAASGADVSGGVVPLLTGCCLVRSTCVSVTILILLENRTQRRRERILSADCTCFRNSSEIPSEIQRFRCLIAHRSGNLRGQHIR